MKNKIVFLVLSIFFLQLPLLSLAQFNGDKFGKNRIQHKNIEWYYYSSNNFEVYYYDGGMNNAKMAIDFLESEFDKITQSVGYVAYTKPRIYIYNSCLLGLCCNGKCRWLFSNSFAIKFKCVNPFGGLGQ